MEIIDLPKCGSLTIAFTCIETSARSSRVRFAVMFDVIGTTFTAFEDYLSIHGDPVVALSFEDSTSERAFSEQDAVFAHFLANLPDRARLPIAWISGTLSGADLALALFCPFVAMKRGAQLSTGFGRPASAAVYVAAARRVGPVACEKLLFGPSLLCAEDAGAAYLASAVASSPDALALATNRVATMISVARANLVTWPMPLAKMTTLMDAR